MIRKKCRLCVRLGTSLMLVTLIGLAKAGNAVPGDEHVFKGSGLQGQQLQGTLGFNYWYYRCVSVPGVIGYWASYIEPCDLDPNPDCSCLIYPQPPSCSWELPCTGNNFFTVSQAPGCTIPSTTNLQIDTVPVQGSDLDPPEPYPDSLRWYYLISMDYGPISSTGVYYADVSWQEAPGEKSCTPYVGGHSGTGRLWLYVFPDPPTCFGSDQGSRLGYGSDSFQSESCGTCGNADFPWPSIVNPFVYAPVSASGGLDGPAAGQFYTGRSGCNRSWIDVYVTCQTCTPEPAEPGSLLVYARVRDKCGKCYVIPLGGEVGSIPPFSLDDGSQVTGHLYSDISTDFHIDYVDGSKADFSLGPPQSPSWIVRKGPYRVTDPEGNRTDTTYNLSEGGQQFDKVVTLPSDPANGETWKYYHNIADPKIRKIQQVATGASSVVIDYNGDNPSQILVKDGAGQTKLQTDYTWQDGKIIMATRGSRKVTYGYTENGQVITVRDIDTDDATMTETVYDYRQPDPNPNEGDTVSTLTTTITRRDPALVNPAPDEVTYYCFYQSGGNKTYLRRVIDPEGKTTTYDRDTSTGRVLSMTDASGLKTDYAYNTEGAVTTTTYSKTGTTTYHENNVYYDNGGDTVWLKTHESIHPADDSSRGNFTYHVRSQSTLWRADAVKVNTQPGVEPANWDTVADIRSLQYYGASENDGLPGQLKKEIVPDIDPGSPFPDYEVTYKYTEDGKRRSSPTEITYKYPNGSGYDLKINHISYDDLGNVLSTTDANATPRTITYEYDALGRQTKTIFGSGVQTENHYTCCTMDWSMDEDGRKSLYAYDDLNRVEKVWTNLDEGGIQYQSVDHPLVQYEYDAFGDVVSVETYKNPNSNGRTTTYSYDSLDRVNTIAYPSPLGTEAFGYTEVGDVLWKKDGNNKYTVYEYDDLHRLTDVYYNYDPGRGLNPPDYSGLISDVTYSYYGGTGLVHTMADSSGTSSYVYDTQDRLTSYTPSLPSGHAPVTYAYNNLGQKKSMLGGGVPVYYNYFANGWLKDVRRDSQAGPLVASYTYDEVGNRTQMDFGNGTWQTFGYKAGDPRYMLETIHYAYNCGSGILDQGGLSITRDNSGNPLTWGDTDGIYARAYTYDKNSRLDTVQYPGQYAVDFTYDWVGNRWNPGSSQFNDADQLTDVNGHTYGYDGAGNLTTIDSTPTYGYTFDRLLSTAGGASMAWDAAGNRVSFTSSTDPTHPHAFVCDPTAGIPAVIEETHDGNSVYYVRDPGGGLICRKEGTATQYYHFDDLGSALFLTGADGAITDRYTYDAWGKPTGHVGTTQQPYQYVGQIGYYTHHQDPNMAGLLQLGVRFYDPETGRFTQGDPIQDSLNWYAYVGGNPIAWIDPQGLTMSPSPFLQKDERPWYSLEKYLDSMTPADIMMMGIGPELGAGKALIKPRAIKTISRVSRAAAVKVGEVACEEVERHHRYVRQFAPQFKRAGINWKETVLVEKGAHRLKPNGLHTGSESVNKLWKQFFDQYPDASPTMIKQEADWIDYLKSK